MLLQRPNVSALGEVGLDYSVAPSLRQAQRERLSEVLKLAIPEKVLVLHLRGESRDHLCSKPSEHCLDMVRKCCAPEQKIHLHCFAGSTSIMRHGPMPSQTAITLYLESAPLQCRSEGSRATSASRANLN